MNRSGKNLDPNVPTSSVPLWHIGSALCGQLSVSSEEEGSRSRLSDVMLISLRRNLIWWNDLLD